MANPQAVVYIAASTEQAHILANLLGEHGISAHVTNEALQLGIPSLHVGLPTASRVIVAEAHAEAARLIALEFDESHRTEFWDEDLCRLEDDADEETRPWPACPHCNRGRHTSCPVCGTAGSHFEAAFLPPDQQLSGSDQAATAGQSLVLCHACDEPFVPAFPARCEWCGHRFADGYEAAPIEPSDQYEFNHRVGFAVAVLFALVAVVIAIFASLVPKS